MAPKWSQHAGAAWQQARAPQPSGHTQAPHTPPHTCARLPALCSPPTRARPRPAAQRHCTGRAPAPSRARPARVCARVWQPAAPSTAHERRQGHTQASGPALASPRRAQGSAQTPPQPAPTSSQPSDASSTAARPAPHSVLAHRVAAGAPRGRPSGHLTRRVVLSHPGRAPAAGNVCMLWLGVWVLTDGRGPILQARSLEPGISGLKSRTDDIADRS